MGGVVEKMHVLGWYKRVGTTTRVEILVFQKQELGVEKGKEASCWTFLLC